LERRGLTPAIRPIRRQDRLVDEIHERLLKMVARGELAPHRRLLQQRLAEELGVSRTPVREALLRLEREGLVYSLPRRGMFVKGITPTEVLELYEVRALLEPYAARRACERASARDIAQIQSIQRRHEQQAGDGRTGLQEALRTNAELHLRIVRGSANEALRQFLTNFWTQEQALRIFALQVAVDHDAIAGMVREHGAITEAFVARDADRVEALLRSHIEDAMEELRKQLGAMEMESLAAAERGVRVGDAASRSGIGPRKEPTV
jgi:DNA-binding GntR family transcriptional regulator